MEAILFLIYIIYLLYKEPDSRAGLNVQKDAQRALKAYYALPYYSMREFSNPDGTVNRVEYYNIQGQLHRTNGPAREYANGLRVYIVNGHRLSKEQFNKLY